MKRSDFLVVTSKTKTVITYKQAVRIELDYNQNAAPSQMLANFIQQQRRANQVITDIINGESTFLIAQSLIHAIANQN